MAKKVNSISATVNIVYPYQVTDLDSLPGEEWADIPGFDGLYEVSNFGRIKRLSREVLTSAGHTLFFKEKIRRLDCKTAYNKSIQDFTFYLSVSLCIEGQRTKLSVPRLVYYCFVSRFPIDNEQLVILPRDGNGKNIRPENLLLSDPLGRILLVYERHRSVRAAETTLSEYLNSGRIKSVIPQCRQVSQYSGKGKFLQTFPSITVASEVTGVNEDGIISVLKGRQIRSGGFHWQYGADKRKVDLKKIRETTLANRRMLVGRKVTQYNKKGKRVGFFDSITTAASSTGVNSSDIHAVLNGKQRSAGGFIWRDGKGPVKINLSGFLTGVEYRASKRWKKVKKIDMGGLMVKEYKSVNEAAQFEGCSPSYMTLIVKQKRLYNDHMFK